MNRQRSIRGTGSMTQRANGSWRLVVSLPPDPLTGIRRQRTRTVHGSKKQARDTLNAMLAERGQLDGSTITVYGLVSEWLEHEDRLAAGTKEDYLRVRRQFLLGPFGQRPASKVTVAEVNALYRELGRKGATPHRLQRLHTVLRRAYTLGMKWEWLSRNPVALADPPEPETVERTPPNPAEVVAFLAEAGPRFAVFLRLAAVTGARRGELCQLRWDDLDLADATVRFRRETTKSRRPKVLALDEDTVTILEHHRAGQAEIGADVPEAFVFSEKPGGLIPLRADVATKRFSRLRQQVGLTEVHLHDLRHAAATFLLSEGFDARTTADRLGHANPNVTLQVYAHTLPARDRAAAEALGRRLT